MREVAPISAAEVIAVRWPVLRAGLPEESAVFPGDDLPETIHLGSRIDGQLVGVVTVYPAPFPNAPETAASWQLRGMAVFPAWQGQGVGKELLVAARERIVAQGGRHIWCNARLPALEFYRREGFAIVSELFDIPTAGPHYRMLRAAKG